MVFFSYCLYYCLFQRDVEDAIQARDGYDFGGQTLRVEIPSSRGSKRRYDHGPPAGN